MLIAPVEQQSLELTEGTDLDQPWITLVWNDPVNLMSYVTYVFQTYFGYSRKKSERLMLDVHNKGRAVVRTGPGRRWSTTPRHCRLRAVGDVPEGRVSGKGLPAQG